MDKTAIQRALRSSHISQVQVADLFGVTDRTMRRWLKGTVEPPTYVQNWLKFMLMRNLTVEKVIRDIVNYQTSNMPWLDMADAPMTGRKVALLLRADDDDATEYTAIGYFDKTLNSWVEEGGGWTTQVSPRGWSPIPTVRE